MEHEWKALMKSHKPQGVIRKVTMTSSRCGALIWVEGSPEELLKEYLFDICWKSRWFRWQVCSNVDAGGEVHNAHGRRTARPVRWLFNELRAIGNDIYGNVGDYAGKAPAFELS